MHDYPNEQGEAVGFLDAIRHHWLAIAALVGVAVLAAVTYSVTSSKQYKAEAVMQVVPIPPSEAADDALLGVDVFRESSGGGAITAVYALGRQMLSPQFVDAAKAQLGEASKSRRDFLKSITITPTTQSSTVSVVASDSSPRRAARMANTVVDATLARRGQTAQRQVREATARFEARLPTATPTEAVSIQDRLAVLASLRGLGDPTVDVLTPAVPPESSSGSSLLLAVVVAVLAALLLGILLALALERLVPRLAPDDPLVRRLPVLARVPRASTRVVRSYLNGRGTLPGDLWEAYRILRANLGVEQPTLDAPRSVLVTSALQGEGKTMTSTNLAIVLAAAGHRVILVDGDLRRPMVGRVFNTRHGLGFTDLLNERASVQDVLVDGGRFGDRLRLVLPGSDRPPDLLEAARIRPVIAKLEQAADVIVIDSPALSEFADALPLARAVDAVIIAVRFGRSRRDRYRELLELFRDREITPVGVVVTGHRRARSIPGVKAEPPGVAGVRVDDEADDELAVGVGHPRT
jgi:capsular exopolysaccharide synthesis family protein